MLRSLLDPYAQPSYFAPVLVQGKIICGRTRGAKGKGRVTLSLPPSPILIPVPQLLLLPNKSPQNLTAQNNCFFTLTNCVGQEFGQSTGRVAYVCSAIPRTSTGKTLQLELTQQLETGSFWRHLHLRVWWLMLAVSWDLNRSTPVCPLPRGVGFLTAWPLRAPIVSPRR